MKGDFVSQLIEDIKSQLFHLCPVPMWIADVETEMFLEVNEAAIAYYGYSNEEFLSMNLNDICTNDSEKSSGKESPCIHIRKDGQLAYIREESRLFTFGGFTLRLTTIFEVRENIKIKLLNQKLRKIAWTYSHCLRAPMATIIALAELIKLEKCNKEKDKLLRYLTSSVCQLDQAVQETGNNGLF
jgi:PAS domain-containing protein